jgi:hypothetical protein
LPTQNGRNGTHDISTVPRAMAGRNLVTTKKAYRQDKLCLEFNEAFRLGILKLQNRIHLFINFICSANTAHSPASPMSTELGLRFLLPPPSNHWPT